MQPASANTRLRPRLLRTSALVTCSKSSAPTKSLTKPLMRSAASLPDGSPARRCEQPRCCAALSSSSAPGFRLASWNCTLLAASFYVVSGSGGARIKSASVSS